VPAIDVFALDLGPSAESVRKARTDVGSWASGVGAADVVDIVQLLVSELATNAVVASGEPYTVVARWQSPVLHVEVIDGAPLPGLAERQPGRVGQTSIGFLGTRRSVQWS
jgi:hypothetical protein